MPRHWVHSGDPFGKKRSQLIFCPKGPPSCSYPIGLSQILNPLPLLIIELAEVQEVTETSRTSKLILVVKHSPFDFKAILDPLSHILLIWETAEFRLSPLGRKKLAYFHPEWPTILLLFDQTLLKT